MKKQYILFSVESGYLPEFSRLPAIMEKALIETKSRIMWLELEGDTCYMIVECGDPYQLGKQRHAFAQEAMTRTGSSEKFHIYLEESALDDPIWEVIANRLRTWYDTITGEGLRP